MNLLKNEWTAKEIHLNKAKEFAEQWHYAQGAGDLAHKCYGLFYKKDLKTLHGIAIWNPPAIGAAKWTNPDEHQSVLGLSRFCLVDDRPDNSGSFLISQSIKQLDKCRWKVLLTFADTAQGHNGGLYRASNWLYRGLTNKNPVYWDSKGCTVSCKRGAKTYNRQEMLDRGYIYKGRCAKHRFTYNTLRRNMCNPSLGKQYDLMFNKKGKIVIPEKNIEEAC